MEMAGGPALQQIIQFRLIDNEARRRGITVTPQDLDEQLQRERAKLAAGASTQGQPTTLDRMLKQHHLTPAQFDVILTHNIELRKLLAGKVEVFPLYHIRAVMVFVSTPGSSQVGPKHTDAQAKAKVELAGRDLKSGRAWVDVVKQYSEDAATKDNGGDIGITNKADRYDPAFVETAATLKNGEVSAPFKILDGFAIEQRVSAGDDHAGGETEAYRDAESAYEEYTIGRLVPQYVQSLQSKAKIVNYFSK